MRYYQVFRKEEIKERSLFKAGDIRVTDNGGIFLNIHMMQSEDFIILPDREQRHKYIVFSMKEYEVAGETRKKWQAIGELSIQKDGEKHLRLNLIPANFIVLGDFEKKGDDILASGELHPLR